MPVALAWLGVSVVGLCGALAAVLELLLVPLYVGQVLVPIAVVLALVSNVALPRMALRLVPRTGAAAIPFVTWLAVVVGFGVLARPEGDVILPGGTGWLPWVSYGVMFGGAFVGIITVVTSTATQAGGRPRPERPAAPTDQGAVR